MLRRLIAEGYEGEALVERYAAVCPHVIQFEDAKAAKVADGSDASEAKRLSKVANGDCASDSGMAREARETERTHVSKPSLASVPVSPPSRRATCRLFARGDFACRK